MTDGVARKGGVQRSGWSGTRRTEPEGSRPGPTGSTPWSVFPNSESLGLRPVKHLGEPGRGIGTDADLLQHADTRPALIVAGPDDLLGV